MGQPYIGEIRMFAGNFAPAGWAFCDGSLQSIAENDTLFALIGTTYGGDGQNTFGLPDLRGRVPVHAGQGPGLSLYTIGQLGGVESVTITTNQLPVHNHAMLCTANIATQQSPSNNVLAQSTLAQMYIQDSTDSTLAGNSIGPIGGSQPHENMQPFLTISFIISLFGIFPSAT